MSKKLNLYFDYAAATPLDSRVEQAMKPFLANRFYNPSSLYESARRTRQALEAARQVTARVIGAQPSEVVFTAGATESINLAISGIARQHPGGNIVISSIEHEAVMQSAKAWFPGRVKICPVMPNGIIDMRSLENVIDSQTVLVSVMLANNEIGTIQPLAKISKLLIRQKHKIYLHSDAAQAANYLGLAVKRLGVDMLTLNGAKTYGPKQSGCLYISRGMHLEPLIYGGGQERGLRSGTENIAQAAGFATALNIAQSMRENESKRLHELRNELWLSLQRELPGIILNGDLKNRLPNNLNIILTQQNGERLVHQLDALGIQVATGSACSANNDLPSHVLLAIGRSKEAANSSLRITLGRQTSESSVQELVRALKLVVAT